MTDTTLAAAPTDLAARWTAAVEKALKGAPFDRLRSTTRDGIAVEPLYPRVTGPAPIAARPAGTPWRIGARVDHPDPAAANELLLADLEGGVSSVTLVFPGSPFAFGQGVGVETVADLQHLLAGVIPEIVEFRLDAGHEGRHALAILTVFAERAGLGLDALTVSAGLDPLGYLATRGAVEMRWDVLRARVADAAAAIARATPSGRTRIFTADGRPWHAGGASEAQELAGVAAATAAYWRVLVDAGLPLADAVRRVETLLVADQDQFATIAKFRAFRLIHARMAEAAGLSPTTPVVHAETAWRMMTRRDPHVNMLRTTVAAFAAGVGGADAVTTLPFTAAIGLPDAFARRVARNTQSVLLEESNLWRIADPAAGSGYVETLTAELAAAGWALFREIEAAGGLFAALKSGAPQAKVKAVAAERAKAVARRREPITGTSEFPNVAEKGAGVLDVATPPRVQAAAATLTLPPPGDGALFAALVAAAGDGIPMAAMAVARGNDRETVDALPPTRLAEPFEALRDAADAETVRRGGARPTVFVATLGPIADFTARATFVKNLFEAGGFSAPVGDGYASLAAMVDAFQASGAAVACLASSDAVYAAEAEKAARVLVDAGAAFVYLAGRPADEETRARQAAAGIDGYVHVGIDVVAELKKAQAAAGIAPVAG